MKGRTLALLLLIVIVSVVGAILIELEEESLDRKPRVQKTQSHSLVKEAVKVGELTLVLAKKVETGSFFVAVDSPQKVKAFTLKNPNRIVLDVLGEKRARNHTVKFSSLLVKQVRVGRHSNKARIVVDLNQAIPSSRIKVQQGIRLLVKGIHRQK